MAMFTNEQVSAVMGDIAAGRVTVRPTIDPAKVYAGNVRYEASNGRTIVVFNDCNEWDYLDSIEVDGEVVATFGSMYPDDADGAVDFEEIVGADMWRIWRIPGWITCRCHGCGEVVERERMPEEHEGLTRCSSCDEVRTAAGWEATYAPVPSEWRLCKAAQRLAAEH